MMSNRIVLAILGIRVVRLNQKTSTPATVTYIGFDDTALSGEIVVHSEHSRAVMAVFESLFDNDYPIESIIPIGDLPEGAEDDDPEYSNTSGFHCRTVAGTDRC